SPERRLARPAWQAAEENPAVLGADQSEVARRESWKDAIERGGAEMFSHHLREDRSEIGGEREIPAFVELFGFQTRPPAVDLAAVHVTTDHEEAACVTVVGSAAAVLPRRPAELRHREDDDVRHAIAEVRHERVDRLRKIVEPRRELTRRATLVDMGIPPADVGEGDFHPDIRLHELRD